MEKITNRPECAERLFKTGFNCAQSVVLTFADILPISERDASMLASPFGGGMGRMREVCGAVTGMYLVLGLLDGYSDPADLERKKALYCEVRGLAEEFKCLHGDIVCRNLLNKADSSPIPENRTEEYYKKRPCAEIAASAAGILEKLLKEKGLL